MDGTTAFGTAGHCLREPNGIENVQATASVLLLLLLYLLPEGGRGMEGGEPEEELLYEW